MRHLIGLVAVLVALAATAYAGPFDTIGYQGVLTDQNGVVVSDGDYSIVFTLYVGSSPVWTETQLVPVAGGRFNVALGSVNSLATLPFDQSYSLGIKVGADPEMTPRTPLHAVPYSLRARSVEMNPSVHFHSSCAEAFSPNSGSYAFNRNTLKLYPTSGSALSFAAPLHLPHGAVMSHLQVLFEDYDGAQEATLALRRTNLNDGSFQSVAAVASGVANASGGTIAETSFFSHDTVDNENWAYSLQVYFPQAVGDQLTLVAVRITYDVMEPQP